MSKLRDHCPQVAPADSLMPEERGQEQRGAPSCNPTAAQRRSGSATPWHRLGGRCQRRGGCGSTAAPLSPLSVRAFLGGALTLPGTIHGDGRRQKSPASPLASCSLLRPEPSRLLGVWGAGQRGAPRHGGSLGVRSGRGAVGARRRGGGSPRCHHGGRRQARRGGGRGHAGEPRRRLLAQPSIAATAPCATEPPPRRRRRRRRAQERGEGRKEEGRKRQREQNFPGPTPPPSFPRCGGRRSSSSPAPSAGAGVRGSGGAEPQLSAVTLGRRRLSLPFPFSCRLPPRDTVMGPHLHGPGTARQTPPRPQPQPQPRSRPAEGNRRGGHGPLRGVGWCGGARALSRARSRGRCGQHPLRSCPSPPRSAPAEPLGPPAARPETGARLLEASLVVMGRWGNDRLLGNPERLRALFPPHAVTPRQRRPSSASPSVSLIVSFSSPLP